MTAGDVDVAIPLAAIGGPARRVMIVVDTVGGVWTLGMQLGRALEREGVAVLLAGVGPELSEAAAREAASIPGLECAFLRARLEWMQDPWPDIERTRNWLLELEASFQPEVVHLNQLCYANAGFKAATLVVAHTSVYSWYESVRGAAPGPEWEPYRLAAQEGLSAADGVSGISDTLLDELANWHGHFRRLPLARIGRELPPISDEDQAKKNYILSAGHVWDEATNIALLDSIAAQQPWPIRVAGPFQSPENGDEVRFDHVELLGPVADESLGKLMSEAAIYAAPALREPFGFEIMEAARAGCALVLADIPSLVSVWEGAAIFVSPRNPHCWETALTQLIEDEAMRTHLGELARSRSRSPDFSASLMGKSYLKIYDELAASLHPVETDKIA